MVGEPVIALRARRDRPDDAPGASESRGSGFRRRLRPIITGSVVRMRRYPALATHILEDEVLNGEVIRLDGAADASQWRRRRPWAHAVSPRPQHRC
jgi:hypothetical protein